jgi:ubiquinone/menaquinone biosynthesis C-methylase UbiE
MLMSHVEYSKSAPWYDKIYGFKDYVAEAAMLRQLIEQHRPGARRLLDVACGTGEHLRHLRQHFEVTGVDAGEPMLQIARRKLPGVPLHCADMRRFDLGATFDAAICMFGATGHLRDDDELLAAIRRIARHLEPGGVMIVEPFLAPEVFVAGKVSGLFVDEPELKISRMSVGRRQGRLAILDMHHLIATPAGVEYFVESLKMTLFPHAAYRSAMAAVGLSVEFDPQGPMGRGLFVGSRPAT